MPLATSSTSSRPANGPAPSSSSRYRLPRQKHTGPSGGARQHEARCRARETSPRPGPGSAPRSARGQSGGVVQKVDEGVGPGRDHPHPVVLVRLLDLAQTPREVVLEVVDEALHDAGDPPRSERLDAGARGGGPCGSARRHLVGAGRRQELLEQHGARDGRPPVRSVVGRAVRLAVVGQHVEVVAVLGHPAQHPPELVDRAHRRARSARIARRCRGPQACAKMS